MQVTWVFRNGGKSKVGDTGRTGTFKARVQSLTPTITQRQSDFVKWAEPPAATP